MSYALYGKRSVAIPNTETGELMGPDKTFRALNEKGVRVNKLEDAFVFYTREDAEEFMNKHTYKPGVEVEIRKVKD